MVDRDARPRHESPAIQVGVGLFVAVAAVAFVWLLIALSQGPERYPLVAEFDSLAGEVNEATLVKLRGYTVGQVEGIQFRPLPPPGKAHFLVTLGIDAGIPVPAGTVADIRGSGLVGESYIHLDVTGAKRSSLASGAHLQGRSAESMKTLMTKIREAAEKLGGAGRSIRDADLGERLGQISTAVTQLSSDLRQVSHSADSLLLDSRRVVADMEPGVRHSLASLDCTMTRLAVTMARADTLVGATSQDVSASVRSLRELVEHLNAVVSRVDSLVILKQSEVGATLANVHAASAAIRDISEHPWKLVVGRGDGRVAEEMPPPHGATRAASP